MLDNTEGKIKINNFLELNNLINKAEKILMVAHRNPDGDSLGCMTAMMDYLERKGNDYSAFSFDGVPRNLEYLPHSQNILADKNQLEKNKFDLVLMLDCADMRYSGIEDYLAELRKAGVKVVNIDHHKDSNYGDLNIVDENRSATSLIIYKIFNWWEVQINKQIATSLLAGILFDTGNFSNSATSVESLRVAGDLIRKGGRLNDINRNINLARQDKGWFIFWSRVLSRLTKNDKLKVVYSVILEDDLVQLGDDAADGVANFFNHMQEAIMIMVLKETEKSQIKVSLRAINNKIDVAKIASFFGGGGHRKAAGFSLPGRLEQEGKYWKII